MPKFRTPKRQGEWAEQLLIAKLMELGLNPSVPVGDDTAYDVVVENPATSLLRRVQVKSVGTRDPSNAYVATSARSTYRGKVLYTPREIDLFAIYIVPEQVWYIVPVRVMCPRRCFRVRPQAPGRLRRYERYREAWQLMF